VAAGVLGVAEVVPLGFEDGYLSPSLELRKAVTREIRRRRPDAIITPHDPDVRTYQQLYLNHPDHIAVGEVVYRAFNPDASSGLMFPELWREESLAPHLPKALFVSNFMDGSTYVDITDTFDLKTQALARHRSQLSDPEEAAGFVRERAEAIGEKAGVKYAEAFNLFRFGDRDR
jgi:LmbE family N-acetylglucosaminyl deacetylase